MKLKQVEMDRLRKECKEKEKLLKETEVKGAEEERHNLTQQYNMLSSSISGLAGELKQMQIKIKEIRDELNEPQYRDAEANFRDCYVKRWVYEKTRKDICRYRAALDHAIMKFHSKQMEAINQYLDHYWRIIYQGNDIETIRIKTDNAEDPGEENKLKVNLSVKSRKTYNYRFLSLYFNDWIDLSCGAVKILYFMHFA